MLHRKLLNHPVRLMVDHLIATSHASEWRLALHTDELVSRWRDHSGADQNARRQKRVSAVLSLIWMAQSGQDSSGDADQACEVWSPVLREACASALRATDSLLVVLCATQRERTCVAFFSRRAPQTHRRN